MNEQLVVKNFGPIKDATVDFKRVTVFIGPTGGGKSTLAKLAAIFKSSEANELSKKSEVLSVFKAYSFDKYIKKTSYLSLIDENENIDIINGNYKFKHITSSETRKKIAEMRLRKDTMSASVESLRAIDSISLKSIASKIWSAMSGVAINYIPSERSFVSSLEYSWAGLLRDDIGLPKTILDFANKFSNARKAISELDIIFLQAKYVHRSGQDFIKFSGIKTLFRLYETASGIQSVTPMLVLLEHLSRNTEQAQSFIIEEPELNLYPTAQQGLLNWLVEKCTKGQNDLTITTHSPYLLAHFNTLLFAYQVAQNHPERADEIAKIVPRESWINPAEFAAYHVEGQKENGVRSIVNLETGLISYNGLDAIASAEAGEFEKLLDINAGLPVEW